MFMNENLDLKNSDEKIQRKMFKKETGKVARRVLFYNLILVGVVLLFTIFLREDLCPESPLVLFRCLTDIGKTKTLVVLWIF